MIAAIHSAVVHGYGATLVTVEADARQGLPGVSIVGMGNKAVNEARDRVRSALRSAGLDFPARKYTINLAPADLPKRGTHLDLPIALSILVSSGQLRPQEVAGYAFAGELALDGTLRPIPGSIAIAQAASMESLHAAVFPAANVTELRLVDSIRCIGASSLRELFLHLKGITPIVPYEPSSVTPPKPDLRIYRSIIGLEQPKRALAIAAAGSHNLLLTGVPGTGKTLLAQALAELLPPLSRDQAKEMLLLHSLGGQNTSTLSTRPPFRAPHHSVSRSTLIGGGSPLRPGEISLAHNGCLLLDELPEFGRTNLEALRQPLEDGVVTLARHHDSTTYPARALVVATMNPCPCGYYGDEQVSCRCSSSSLRLYRERLSGPLLDRFDMHLRIPRSDSEQIMYTDTLQKSHHPSLYDAVQAARNLQITRYKSSTKNNSTLSLSDTLQQALFEPDSLSLAQQAARQLSLSTRGFLRVLRVSRTIADLELSDQVRRRHVAEALQFRSESFF